MSNNKERRIPDYLKFPFDRFLMVRVEFLILTQNELEAKIMRIIEWAIENKRDELSLKGQRVPDEVWVTIPQRFFMEWLYGTVQSETTFKDAVNSLIDKHLIFKQQSGVGRYDAMAYTLNKPLIAMLFGLFPKNLNDVDMASVMKQPRKSKTTEDQLLTPSIIDPLILRMREAIIDPLNHQLLTPSSELGEGQKLTPIKKEKKNKKESTLAATKIEPDSSTLSPTSSLSSQVTHNVEKLSTQEIVNPVESPASMPFESNLTAEEQRIQDYWCELGFVAPSSSKKHWALLSKHVNSQEQMKSLYEYTRASVQDNLNIKDKQVFPGNLVKCLNGWKQMQEIVAITQAAIPKRQKLSEMTFEQRDEYFRSQPY